ncbi:hypothetical protein NX773_08825 [Massilia solisilvae]|uniref:Uncharacterized protein n=1 Tax=Massilia solisilvae TaxID=1811225 RepID=A0ABT2BIM6_9BURK|nr:hypothetical protein [Massilia solisilvae]MCS0608266.1 hypothetical protein [Massilia solisilvae]
MPITADSFVLLNSTPAKIAQLDAALQYLQLHSPEIAAPILAAAAESQVRIIFSDPKINPSDGYGEQQHVIVWDPDSALVVTDIRGNAVGVQSAANGLFHEVVHAIDINQAVREHIPNGQYGNDAEAVAVMYADAVAKDCGEIQRNNYEGSELSVSNVTEHTGDDGTGHQVWRQTNPVGQEETGPRYKAGDPAPGFGYAGNEHDNDPPASGGGGGGGSSGTDLPRGGGGSGGGSQGNDQPGDPGSVGTGDNDDPDHQPTNPGSGSGDDGTGEDEDGQVGSGIDNGPAKDGSGPGGGRNRDDHEADLHAKLGAGNSLTLHHQDSPSPHGLLPKAPVSTLIHQWTGNGGGFDHESTMHDAIVVGVPTAFDHIVALM